MSFIHGCAAISAATTSQAYTEAIRRLSATFTSCGVADMRLAANASVVHPERLGEVR